VMPVLLGKGPRQPIDLRSVLFIQEAAAANNVLQSAMRRRNSNYTMVTRGAACVIDAQLEELECDLTQGWLLRTHG